MLSTEAEVTDTTLANLASFVCAAYFPKGIYIYTISELRGYLFCKHMTKSDKLPFTLGAWRQHVLRVHIQTAQASQSVRTFIHSFFHSEYLYSAPSRNLFRGALSPSQHCSAAASVGFPAKWLLCTLHKESDGQLKPTMSGTLPAPKAIIHLVSCHCKSDCSPARFSCRTNNLSCTDLCRCGSECQNDEATQNKH